MTLASWPPMSMTRPAGGPQEMGPAGAGLDLGHDPALQVAVHQAAAVARGRGPARNSGVEPRPDPQEGVGRRVEDVGVDDLAAAPARRSWSSASRGRSEEESGPAMTALPLQAFDERLDPDPQLADVLLGVIGLDLETGDAGLLQGVGHGDGLDVVGVAGLEDVLDDAVGPVLPGQPDDGLDPLGVRREARAIDREIAIATASSWASRPPSVSSTRFPVIARAGAGLVADDHRARGLDHVVQLPVAQDRRASGDHDPLGPSGGAPTPRRTRSLELLVEGLEPVREPVRIVDQGGLHDDQRVGAADGRGRFLPEVVEPGQGPPLAVHEPDGGHSFSGSRVRPVSSSSRA